MTGGRYGERRRQRRVQARAQQRGAASGRSQGEARVAGERVEFVALPGAWSPAGFGGSAAPLVLVVPGGYRVEVGAGFHPPTLRRLLDALEGVGCSPYRRA